MTDISMTKSELIERIVAAQARSSNAQLNSKDVEFAVKTMLEQMSQTLARPYRNTRFWQLFTALSCTAHRAQP